MSPAELDVLLRQERLRQRSAVLRARIGRDVQVLRRPLEAADAARAGLQWLRRHPEVPVGLAVATVVVRPSRAWHWGWRLWGAWQAWRRLQRWAGLGGRLRSGGRHDGGGF